MVNLNHYLILTENLYYSLNDRHLYLNRLT